MIPNIKLDIVYYLTATDFEMEFNLGGCCRMRMLTDRVSDKKAYIKSLSRAVSRSKIILACGPLFGEDGLIYITSKAIGAALVTADNSEYGIDGNAEIKIMENSVPLVTRDGIFGGCIIESGPQTIILLTENRGTRKDIMKNLIHPYIEETSLLEATKQPPDINIPPVSASPTASITDGISIQSDPEENFDAQSVPAENENGEVLAENEKISEEITEEAQEERSQELTGEQDESAGSVQGQTEDFKSRDTAPSDKESTQECFVQENTDISADSAPNHNNFNDIPFIFDDGEASPNEQTEVDFNHEEDFKLITESQHVKQERINRYAMDYIPSKEDSMLLLSDEENRSSNHNVINISIIIIAILLIVIAAALCYILIYLPHSKGMSVTEYLSDIMWTSGPVKNLIIR